MNRWAEEHHQEQQDRHGHGSHGIIEHDSSGRLAGADNPDGNRPGRQQDCIIHWPGKPVISITTDRRGTAAISACVTREIPIICSG